MAYGVLLGRGLIGLVFAASTFAKVRDLRAYREFASWLAALPVPLARSHALPAVLATVEAAIVVLVAVPGTVTAGLALASGFLVVMATGTTVIIKRGTSVACWCFGPSRSTMGARHLVRDGVLLVAAVTSLLGKGSEAMNPAGITLSLAAAVTGATFVVFADDLIAVFGRDPAGAAGMTPRPAREKAGKP
jgi:hypothetical protein